MHIIVHNVRLGGEVNEVGSALAEIKGNKGLAPSEINKLTNLVAPKS